MQLLAVRCIANVTCKGRNCSVFWPSGSNVRPLWRGSAPSSAAVFSGRLDILLGLFGVGRLRRRRQEIGNTSSSVLSFGIGL